MYRCDILLRPSPATNNDVVLRKGESAGADVYLYPRAELSNDIWVRRQRYDRVVMVEGGGPGFPTQYFGLKTFYQGAVKDLCLVAEVDAPGSMGGVLKVNKNGTLYAVYLVETSDPDASPCYIRTSSGTKAIREKT